VTPENAGRATILVVDDESWIRQITVRVLRDSGYTVLEARSGAEALEILRATGPASLVLADVAMPEMDGVQLAEEIRKRNSDQLVAFLSAYAGLIPRLEMKGPPLPILEKPIEPNQLVDRIKEILERRGIH
jgi:two-component system cell cycle sensor histidine kinase/response regulator CckA